MDKKKYLSDLTVYALRGLLYIIMYTVFIGVFSRMNQDLVEFSRASVFIGFVFFVALFLLAPVYGNFEIGIKKSKPVIYSTVVSILFTDCVAFVGFNLMSVSKVEFSNVFLVSLGLLSVVFLLQVGFIIFFTYLGNYIYFKLNDPTKTIVIYANEDLKDKIIKYIDSHKKQYELVRYVKNVEHSDICIADVENVFLLGMSTDYNNKMVENCFYESKSVYFDADMYDVLLGNNRTIVYDDVLMVEYTTQKLTLFQKFIKRLIDIIFALVFVVLTAPIMLVVAIMIKLDDGGPVFYRQERMTEDLRIFEIIKFRSMKLNSGNKPAAVDDDRITKAGKVIRKLRLDELPQFINILKGDMSVVGPRPESVAIMEDIMDSNPKFVYRLKVKAGLTGYAQIFGKYNTTSQQKLLMDLKYIETYTVLNDIKLMLQTVNVFFKSDSTEGFDL